MSYNTYDGNSILINGSGQVILRGKKYKNPTFEELIPDFINYIVDDKNQAERTAQKYKESLGWFLKDLPQLKNPRFLLPTHITELKKAMKDRGAGPARINSVVYTLRSFLRYCHDVHDLDVLDPVLVKVMRVPFRQPQNLTEEEIKLFLNSLNPELPTELRMRVLCEFLLSTLLRISEALSVNIADINWEKKEIVVIGKGNKQNTVYLKDRTVEWLKRYLATRKDSNPALFVTTGSNSKRLTSHDQSKIFKVYAKRVPSITKPITPHSLRRSSATILSKNGAPLKDIQTLLAHADVSTTLRHYIAVDKEQVRQSHNKFLQY